MTNRPPRIAGADIRAALTRDHPAHARIGAALTARRERHEEAARLAAADAAVTTAKAEVILAALRDPDRLDGTTKITTLAPQNTED